MMMRELKFRAWQKQGRELFQVGALQFRTPSFVVKEHSLETWTLDEVELMQYIGLHDANDVEIYEGDILSIEGATAHVVFWETPPEFGLDFSHNEDAWCEDWNLADDSARMEIIGNIYEHPELLVKPSSSEYPPW